MPKLTAKKRNNLLSSDFAEPGQRKYPIPDRSHARNALARVSQHGTAQEKAKVRKKVSSKFPGLSVSGLKKGSAKKIKAPKRATVK